MTNINPVSTAQSNWPAANQRASAKPKEAEGSKPAEDKNTAPAAHESSKAAKSASKPGDGASAPEKDGKSENEDKKDEVTPTTTTVNTDRVDAEIKGLKEKVGQLQKRLQSADANERVKLEEQLAQANAELSNKNTDAYRKANASVSTVDFYV